MRRAKTTAHRTFALQAAIHDNQFVTGAALRHMNFRAPAMVFGIHPGMKLVRGFLLKASSCWIASTEGGDEAVTPRSAEEALD